MLGNCSEPGYVFQDFDHLRDCYQRHGGRANSNPFTQLVNNCINDYCNNTFPPLGGCEQWTGPTDLDFSVTYNSSLFMGYTSFNNEAACAGVEQETNPDIAGPGIFIAYMMQLVVIIYLWFFIRLSQVSPIIASYFPGRKQSQKTPVSSQKQNTVKARLSKLFHRHNAVLKHTLIEFQEAQCFFMLASQIAILWATKSRAAFESYTLRSLLANYGVAGLVSTTGILPVVIGLWSLQRMRLNSPWIFALSVVTFIVSEVALFGTRDAPSVDQIVPIDYNGWPESCGFFPPPLVYCGISTSQIETRVLIRGGAVFFTQWSNNYCLTVFTLIILLWIKSAIIDAIDDRSRRGFFLARIGTSQSISMNQRVADSKWGKWLQWAYVFLTCLIEATLVAAIIMDITAFGGLDVVGLIDWSAWSFGQIVAITLWLPVVSKYFYWLMFGAKAYSRARIPTPYKLVRAQVDEGPHEGRGDYDRVGVVSVGKGRELGMS